MKIFQRSIVTAILLIISIYATAQKNENINTYIKQGIALNDSGKYSEAVAKYKKALDIDPQNLQVQYELSYTLVISGKPKEAIPFLERVAISNTNPEAYNLLASIYDDTNDFERSFAYYKSGIVAFPKCSQLYLNLGISYLRQKKYPEAELISIEAIKSNPKHASNQRIYALANYYQDKFEISLLAWCGFILLEPHTKRSQEGYRYIQKIINNGITRNSNKSVNINVSSNGLKSEYLSLPLAVLGATDNKKNLSEIDSLSLQLTSVFKIYKEIEENKNPQTFFSVFYAKYFGKLAQSLNMPAFARLISLNTSESAKWIVENPKKMEDLNRWIEVTDRSF